MRPSSYTITLDDHSAISIFISTSRISLPRRLGTRTPRHAPLISPPHPQPLLRTQLQLAIQLIARILAMDKIAESATHASFAAVEPTACFAEIGDGGELAVDWPSGIPAGIQCVAGFLRGIFVFEARVHVSDEIW